MFKFIIAYKVGGMWVEESINFAVIADGLRQRLLDVKATHFYLKSMEKWSI